MLNVLSNQHACCCSSQELCEIKGLSEAKVDKIKDAVQKLQVSGGVRFVVFVRWSLQC